MQKKISTLVVLGLALALGACNQPVPGVNPPTNTTPVSQAEAIDTTDAINDEIISATGTATVGGTVAFASFGSVSLASLQSGLGVQASKPACVTVSPSPVVDSDGDGVPDSATYTFDCSRDGPLFAGSKKGTIQIADPSSDVGVWGFDSNINLTETHTSKLRGITVTDVRTGSRSPRKTSDQLVQSHNITVQRSVTGLATPWNATIQNQWNLTFNATTAGSIVMGSPLPAGSIQIAGSYSVTRNGAVRAWTLSTPLPLSYDPACTDDLKIVGGKLLATLNTSSGAGGTLEVVYGACGTDPVVTRTPNS
jgi:hypothetical protein